MVFLIIFQLSYLARLDLYDVISFTSREQESNHYVSLSPNLEPEFSSPRDITKEVLISAELPAPSNNCFEFEEGKEFENTSELDLKITTEDEHHDID